VSLKSVLLLKFSLLASCIFINVIYLLDKNLSKMYLKLHKLIVFFPSTYFSQFGPYVCVSIIIIKSNCGKSIRQITFPFIASFSSYAHVLECYGKAIPRVCGWLFVMCVAHRLSRVLPSL
jgi:hypothetical protein